MSYDGNGTYNPPVPQYPAIPGTTIYAEDFNTIIADIASALSLVLVRDGQSPMLANLNMGGFGLTNIATMAAAVAGLVISGSVSFSGGVQMLSTLGVAGLTTLNAAKGVTMPSGTNTTDLATCAFVLQTAMNAALPNQAGNAGRYLQTDGVNATWVDSPARMLKVDRSSNTIFTEVNRANVINYTAGGFTQTFTPSGSLTSGWFINLDATSLAASAEGVELEAPATVTTSSTSSTNIAAATSVTVATGLAINTGDLAIVRRTSAGFTTRMWGTVAGYVSGTGVLTLNVLGRVGTGTFTDWTVTTRPANAGIDGLPSYVVWPGERRVVYQDGAGYKSKIDEPFYVSRVTSFTYIHPPGYVGAESDLVGGGAGGGSGARYNSGLNTNVSGGSPGGTPARVRSRQVGLIPGQSYAVVVGAAGTGGTAVNADSTVGNPGTSGGNTTFNGKTAFGGIGGLGGQFGASIDWPSVSGSGSASAGSALYLGGVSGVQVARGANPSLIPQGTTSGTFASLSNSVGEGGGAASTGGGGNSDWGGAAGYAGTVGSGPQPAPSSINGVPAGGNGGCLTSSTATPTATAGTAGFRGSYVAGGGAAGGNCGAAPTAGANGTAATNDNEVGTSGGGGGSTTNTGAAAGKGGDGAAPGGAGGGGGASLGTANSGAGGNGAAGRAWIRGMT